MTSSSMWMVPHLAFQGPPRRRTFETTPNKKGATVPRPTGGRNFVGSGRNNFWMDVFFFVFWKKSWIFDSTFSNIISNICVSSIFQGHIFMAVYILFIFSLSVWQKWIDHGRCWRDACLSVAALWSSGQSLVAVSAAYASARWGKTG